MVLPSKEQWPAMKGFETDNGGNGCSIPKQPKEQWPAMKGFETFQQGKVPARPLGLKRAMARYEGF